MSDLPSILHVSGDFPDPVEPHKTKVIRTLLELTKHRFEHSVVSINRRSPGKLAILKDVIAPGGLHLDAQDFEYGTAVSYEAPPRGIRHRTRLVQLGDWLAQHIQSLKRRPDLIIGHKLAIEGIAVRRASQITGIPYALSIQGDSDTKIMSVRRDLKGEFQSVLHGAKLVFPFTPWAWNAVTRQVGVPDAPHVMLPCPTDLDEPMPPQASSASGTGSRGLISVFHLQSYKRKNLAGLASAAQLLEKRGVSAPLSVIGGGEPAERSACEAIVEGVSSITLTGPMDREQLRAAMRNASGFVLPSLRESFGLVFVEALFAGLPIIYPKGTAVDGYFDDAPFALPVDARDPNSIAEAMATLVDNEDQMKLELAKWQTSEDAKAFQRPGIAQKFAAAIESAI
ncbi:MAG: glycosyltransferase [Pseudomonadota bacterium]